MENGTIPLLRAEHEIDQVILGRPLLIEAVKDRNGIIIKIGHSEGLTVHTNNKQFCTDREFLNSSQTLPLPPDLDFGTPELRAFSTLSPTLQQVFFIGDGLTGEGIGDVQLFQIPTGATELYLGTWDDQNYNNVGQLRVAITPVPEPSTLLLLGIGTLGLVGWKWRRGKPAA